MNATRPLIQGRFKLDRLVTRCQPLGEINSGFAELRNGPPGRSIIVFGNKQKQ